jgi:hypothetical protein
MFPHVANGCVAWPGPDGVPTVNLRRWPPPKHAVFRTDAVAGCLTSNFYKRSHEEKGSTVPGLQSPYEPPLEPDLTAPCGAPAAGIRRTDSR